MSGLVHSQEYAGVGHGVRVRNKDGLCPVFLCYNRFMVSKNDTPTEDQEQISFVQWLELEGIPYWHTNNEMWTKSWKQKNRAVAMGVKSGIPDLFLCFDGHLVGIEMKRQKGGVVSDNQKHWGAILEASGVPVFVCRGCEHAQETVQYIKDRLGYKQISPLVLAKIDKSVKIHENKRKLKKNEKNDCPF